MDGESEDVEMEMNEEDDWPHHLLEYLPSGVLFEIFKNLTWQELCSVSQTCHRFNELCERATLWFQLKTIDFTVCIIPMAEKMIKILKKCPNTENILLNGIILEATSGSQNDLVESLETNIHGFDKFLLDVLHQCPKLQTMTITNPEMTNSSIDAICAKCTKLRSIAVEGMEFITNSAVSDLVSIPTLRELRISSCENVIAPGIVHRDGENLPIYITHLSLNNMIVSHDCVHSALLHCCQLEVLDLTSSFGFSHFKFDEIPVQNGLKSLKTLILKECQELEDIELPFSPELQTIDVENCGLLNSVKAAAEHLKHVNTGNSLSVKTLRLTPCSVQNLTLSLPSLEEWLIDSSELRSLELIQCARLTCDSLMEAIPHKNALKSLHIEECRHITQDDIQESILQKFAKLEKVVLLNESRSAQRLNFEGPRPWSSIQLTSPVLTELQFGYCKNLTCLPLCLPSLTHLEMCNCRDITESDFIDGLLYGKQLHRARGFDGLVKEIKTDDIPFGGGRGVPNIMELCLTQMSGIQGEKLSRNLGLFKHLRILNIEKCVFMTKLSLHNCPHLTSVTIKSCNRLSSLSVFDVSMLSSLAVMWCSMLQSFSVKAEQLSTLDVTGTNFANFSLESREITQLNLCGVCTQDGHCIGLRCPKLRSLSVQKCDMLTDHTIQEILSNCPELSSINISACSRTRSLTIPSGARVYSLTAHRLLREITPEEPINVQHLTLNNLPKFNPELRYTLLKSCEETLQILDVRAIPGEKEFKLDLHNLTSLTLDQGIHLSNLEILCPKLSYLRIQGCPRLMTLTLKIDKLSRLQVSHSSPLLALKKMTLQVPNIRHLSRVLTMYCPNLKELALLNCHVSLGEARELGRTMQHLGTIELQDCVTESMVRFPVRIDPEELGRTQPIIVNQKLTNAQRREAVLMKLMKSKLTSHSMKEKQNWLRITKSKVKKAHDPEIV